MAAMRGTHAVHWLTAAATCSFVSNRFVSAARTAGIEPGPTAQVTGQLPDINWADTIWRASNILWTLDLIWFLSSLVLSAAVLCWSWLVPTRDEVADKEVMSWFKMCYTLFLSLTSHAAGILGFVGFQTIVMTRIVAASEPSRLWDISDFLLYTSIAISLVAVCASFVFLVVDYLRRLAIASARIQGMRLLLNGQKLEHTGLGRALMSLSIALLVLYFGVLYTETTKKDVADDLLLQRVLSCVTVVLYYANLSSLCESPKVQFHQVSGGSVTEENQLESISLKDFLLRVGDSDGGNNNNCRWLRLTAFLHHLAGEDLALFLKEGRRRAFFPNQRLAPLVHVVCILLLLGLLPGVCQLLTERLFEDPEILDMKGLSAALVPSFRRASRHEQFLLLVGPASLLQVKTEFAQTSRVSLCCGTSDLECANHPLKHSLMQFDEEPAVLEIPTNVSANCTLSVAGLSLYARSELHLRVQMMEEYKLCSCLERSCGCCDGFQGEFSAGDELIVNSTCTPALCDIRNSNRNSGPDCACEEGFVGNIHWHGPHVHGHCRPAPCDVHNAVSRADGHCTCEDGYSGTVSWNGRTFEGTCTPAPCNITSSDKELGLSCRCKSGFSGNISWHGPVPRGSCMRATCDIENSDLQPGRQCRCKGGYLGTIGWNGSVAHGSCEPATCSVMNSNGQRGEACACKDGFSGNITWQGSTAHGTCSPAKCQGIEHATEHENEGGRCRCRDGFKGKIVWRGSTPHGHCSPATCLLAGSNLLPGPLCACKPGFYGNIKWFKSIASGSCAPKPCTGRFTNGIAGPKCACKDGFIKYKQGQRASEFRFAGDYGLGGRSTKRLKVRQKTDDLLTGRLLTLESASQYLRCVPAACKIPNSNRLRGKACSCKDGYTGFIRWKAALAQGSCKPAPCNVRNSNMRSGWSCKCADGFRGKIEWNGSLPVGRCFPVACRVRNSDFAPGPACGCAEGFFGKITWRGRRAVGLCRPRPLCAPEITFATLLETDLTTAFGNNCSRGTMMFVRGFVCNQEDLAIQWTAARAEAASDCNFTFREITKCGIAPDFPRLALPTSCSLTPAQPRCSSKIVYGSAIPVEVQHGCNHAFHGAEYVEWHGSTCGYDLIQWNSRPILVEPPSDLCEVKNRSLGCGEQVAGLPRACHTLAEPAVFVLDLAADLVDLKPFLKIFDSGIFTLVHRELNGSDTTTGTWQTDGEYLSLQWVASSQIHRMAFRCYHSDSSIFVNRFGWRSMTAAWQPPPWWSLKFGRAGNFAGNFNTDGLYGCKAAWSMAGTCYRVVFGEEVTQTLGEPACSSQNTTGPSQARYAYVSSMFAVQTYRSRVPCPTTFAFDELKLEVVDVMVDEPYAEVSHTPCRTNIRYFLNANSLRPCEGLYRGFHNWPADIASVWPFVPV